MRQRVQTVSAILGSASPGEYVAGRAATVPIHVQNRAAMLDDKMRTVAIALALAPISTMVAAWEHGVLAAAYTANNIQSHLVAPESVTVEVLAATLRSARLYV